MCKKCWSCKASLKEYHLLLLCNILDSFRVRVHYMLFVQITLAIRSLNWKNQMQINSIDQRYSTRYTVFPSVYQIKSRVYNWELVYEGYTDTVEPGYFERQPATLNKILKENILLQHQAKNFVNFDMLLNGSTTKQFSGTILFKILKNNCRSSSLLWDHFLSMGQFRQKNLTKFN